MTSKHDGKESALRDGSRLAGDHEADRASFEAVLAEATSWLDMDGVEGVAQGELHGEPCILVLASRPEDQLGRRVPTILNGFQVVIRSSRTGSG